MRKLFTFLLITTCLSFAFSQGGNNRDKIESAKIALITERLNLSPEQAQKFWPIYNQYTTQQREIRKTYEEARRGHRPNEASEEENKQLLRLGMQVKEQSLKLEKDYSQRLLEVINNRQLLSLRKAENDFKAMILKRIQAQQQKRQQMQDRRQNGNNDLQRRRNN